MVTSTAELLRERAAAGGVALVDGASGRSLSWAGVAARAARWLDEPALRERRVGLVVAEPLDMAATYLAALGAGVTVASLNPDGTAPELVAQAETLGLSAVVTDSPEAPHVQALAAAGVAVRTEDLGPVVEGNAPGPAGDGAALIMTTSGTTGTPKVIPLAEQQLLHTARAVASHLRLEAGDRGYSPLPLWHINGLVVGVLAAAVAGSSLVVDRRFSRRSFWQVVAEREVTWVNLVPAIITVLAADGAGYEGAAHLARRVRLARSASAPLADATRARFEDRYGIPVVETYGMTEAASQITANPLEARRPGSVGRPAGVEVRVVDGAGRTAATAEVGDVQIKGPSVTTAYWRPGPQSGSHRATTPDGWLPTGDVGWMDDDGYLFLAGRADDVINRGGEKVQPREIEEVLLADPRVRAVAVVGRPHPTVGEEPVAYVVAFPGAAPAAALVADLTGRVESSLSRFKRPAHIEVVDTLPAGPTGKVRRSEVRRLAASPATAEPRAAAQ